MYSRHSYHILFVLLFLTTNYAEEETHSGLYDSSDAVTILNSDNFDDELLGSRTAWIVEFYNSWCGHCINFAPVWKDFALRQAAWKPVIRIAAVDCSATENTDICRRFDIQMFPIFMLFPSNAVKEDKGLVVTVQQPEELQRFMIDFINNQSITDIPASWPQLHPLKVMHEIWEEMEDVHLLHILVFEKSDSYLGRKLILDTCQDKRLVVRRMLKDSVTKYGIKQFPSLYLINKDGTFQRLAQGSVDRQEFVKAIKGLLPDRPKEEHDGYRTLERSEGAGGGNGPDEMDDKIVVKQKADKEEEKEPVIIPGVYMTDLESTLHYCLRQEVAIKRQIDQEALEALKQFLHILAKYFPGRPEVTTFLQKLYNLVSRRTGEMTGQTWSDMVDNLQTPESFLPDRIKWLACKGSEPKFRGYPCGMWTLFHTLTVSAYQKSVHNPRDLQLDILGAIHGYMQHFFGCKTCVSHFLQMTSTVMSVDRIGTGPVLWLWQAHNSANNRLHGNPSEDPKHPKVNFPPKELCPKCVMAESSEDILEFLLKFYGPANIIRTEEGKLSAGETTESDSNKYDWWELQQRKKDLEKIHKIRGQRRNKMEERRKEKFNALAVRAEDEKDLWREKDQNSKNGNTNFSIRNRASIGWGFSQLDMGMCVLFYVLCTVLILYLYYHFIVRRRHKINCKFWPV